MVTVTFIRHGQSEDNVRTVWAGWKDAPLSALGRKQAQALAESMSSTRYTHIYVSDLKRAHDTGKAVHDALATPVKPPFTVTRLAREQHFGVAEGNEWVMSIPPDTTREELHAQNIYPVYYGRHEKFPEGESMDDLRDRAVEALRQCVLPHIDDDEAHVAIASHGLCISEMMGALVSLDPEADQTVSYKGLLNTAWTRVHIQRRENGHDAADDALPVIKIKVESFNQADHLDGLEDTKEAEDNTSSEARAYFGGQVKDESATNARIEVEATPYTEKL